MLYLKQFRIYLYVTFLAMAFNFATLDFAQAACANIRTWQANANTTVWTTTNNWNPTNPPNTNTESAYIVSDWQIPQYPAADYSLSCLEIASGSMTAATGANTLTIINDYFRNLNSGALIIPGGSTFRVTMGGTSAQSFEHVGTIPRLNINNASSVTITEATTISTDFTITAGSGNVNISDTFTTQQTGAITIPASATVTLEAGATWQAAGGITVNGILKLLPGASLILANGRTLSIGATGTIQLAGSGGSPAIITAADSSSTFTFSVAGKIDADYFSIGRMVAAGLNVTGQILDLSNGSFNYIPNSGYGLTIGATTTAPTTANNIGFFGQSATTPRNVNATGFTGSNITFNNWQGVGDTTNETDPSSKIDWGTEAATQLLLTDSSPSGAPPATIAAGAGYTHFGTFAFALSKTDTASDITSVIFTVDGNNNTSDITGIRVYRDDNNNCVYNAGTDSLVNTYTPSGNPAKFTATFTSGQVQPSSTTPRCVHVLVSTSATAQVNNTIGIKIASTDDIVNSQSYALSDTNSPPLSAGTATITGGTLYRWNGGTSTAMATAANWTPGTVPNNTRDCEIGAGYYDPIIGGAFACRNANWLSTGLLSWNNTANVYSINGALTITTGFAFTATTTAAILNFAGTTAQSVNFNGNTFPGSVQVSNTTGPVTFESSATISGTLALNGGTTRISDGAVVTVTGAITVASGATLDIEPGGTLALGNGSSLTVNSGGSLEIVGNTGKTADIRAVNNSSTYTVTINNGGTISARYYSFKNLGTNGVTINATANINATNFLQNGSYTYPGISNARMLRLFRQIPGNTLDTMIFDAGGSAATGVKSVSTNTTAGTLDMTNYSGSWTGSANSEHVNYIVNWVSLTNTLDLTQEATAPASANQGDVVNLGRFGFKQTSGGAFSDTDITYIRLTLIGTGSSADISSIALYFDSGCTGSGGTLIGTTSFSGSPARAEFSGITGATIPFHATTPPKRCFYTMASISGTATNGATVGVKIDASTHVTNSQNYLFNGAASPPVDTSTTSIVGTTTYWTGTTSTAWATAGNWNGGVPSATLNCVINSAANNPIITTSAICKTVTIGNGNLTINNPGQLEVYGNFENTGTFTQNSRPLIIRDNGSVATSQTISSTSTLDSLQFNKPQGGSITIDSSPLNVNSAVTINGSNTLTMYIASNKTLSVNGGFTLTTGGLSIGSGGTLEIGASQTFTLNGGTLVTTGTNDSYPQSLTNKGKITRRGASGTWDFTATSGTINFVGFILEWLGTSGFNIGGTTNVTQINGGQLRSLPNSAGMRAIQLNTTGTLPSTISNFGWYWGTGNSVPSEGTSYFLGYSSGCSSRTVTFDQWFGDFWPYTTTNTDAKISETACNIVIDRANSPVSLTEFKATPYNGKVVLEWTTGLEWYHKGFNIFRSISPSTGFTQINANMIRNDLFTTNIHGSYAFIDEDASNDVTYYYKLEDISSTDERTLHGPVAATPQSSLGVPPTPMASVIVSSNPSGSQSSGGGGSSAQTPGLVNLEPNVDLLSRTENAMRLKITIPTMSSVADSTHPTYNHVSIPLFAKTIDAGKPELLNRTLMLKVPDGSTTASYTIISSNSANSSLLVAPAPAWVAVGQQYQSQWSLDSVAYASATETPVSPIGLSAIIQNDGITYLPITIHPLAYTANSSNLKKYNEIIVDVFLNGHSQWQPGTPIVTSEVWGSPGALRIGLNKDSVYQITYDQMLAAGVIAPFHLADVSKLKLFIMNQEHPIDVTTANGSFSSGDSIRFYARATETMDSAFSYALLVYDYASVIPGLRMSTIDVSTPSGQANTQPGTRNRMRIEQNNIAIFNEPYEQDMDLFVWGMFYKEVGGATVALETDIDLPYVINNQPVTIQVLAKTRTTSIVNYQSNLEILVNNKAVVDGNISFPGGEAQLLSFTVPGVHFAPGKNKITLRPTGTHLVSGEFDMVYIDYIDVYFQRDWYTDDNKLVIQNTQVGSDFYIDGFTAQPDFIYDISQFGLVDRWTNAQIITNTVNSVAFNSPAHASKGRRIWVSTESALAPAPSMQLIYGSSLADTNNEADVLYIGSNELLDSVEALADYRESEGFKTKLIELDSIYNEFGQGIVSTQAIRDFLIYTNEHWSQAPKYIVILGDGTYDPKGYQNPVSQNHFPVKLLRGSAFNYGSDHWFVTKDNSETPFAVIGRIPASTPAELRAYVQKVLDYEQGTVKPQTANVSLLADKAHYTGENFDAFTNDLKTNIDTWSSSSATTVYSRSSLGDSQFKSQIAQSFASASIIHYMGHGAENMWADSFIFNTNDIDSLSNTKLPVVVAMNCLNANFYDPGLTSFAEKLVMKPSGGAIVFWGSTSMTPPSVQSTYQNAFYEQLIKTQSSVGDAVKLSKQQAATQAPYTEALMSWTVIGDPMVSAVLPVSVTTPQQPEPAPAASGSSHGCSAFGAYSAGHQTPPVDLAFAFLLEALLALALIRFSHYIIRK